MATSTPTVVVLMSTYNGERFVVEQLKSILDPLPPGGRVIVRDDGSRDGTVREIQRLADPRVELTQGPNIGFSRSFLTLLQAAPADADMVMLADQDDVWLPVKIGRAWQHLKAAGDQPVLYGSAQMLVDAELRQLHATSPWRRPPSFDGALTENIITGCTAALNNTALRLLQRGGVPDGVHFHDWWLYVVVSAFGQVVFDPEPTLLYRQHGGNEIGHGAGWLGRQWHIVRFLVRRDWVGILVEQVRALQATYGNELPERLRALVFDHFASMNGRVVPRWRLVFSPRRWRDTLFSELALRVLLALYRLHLWPLPSRRL